MASEADSYNLKREFFGQKLNFKAKEEDTKQIYIKEDPSLLSKFIYKNPRTITLGNSVDKSFHIVHTEKTKTSSLIIKHIEGGWPESVENPNEPRHVNNWKRAKEKGEGFVEKVLNLIENTEDILRQNLRIDVYEDYFDDSKVKKEGEVVEESYSIKIKTVFKDVCTFKRSVSKVCFSPEEQNKIAIAYKINDSDNSILVDKNKLPCLVWDINNPNVPINILYPTNNSEIITCAFNSKYPNILGCGCSNGNILIFDLKTSKQIVTSKLEYCHSESVRDFVWLKSKLGTEFVTTSTDGKVIWWDIRDMNIPKKVYLCPDSAEIKEPGKPDNEADWIKNPNYKSFILVDKEKGSDVEKEYGGLKIEYNPEAGASKFLIVTEQGTIFLANKKKHEAEISQKYGFQWGRHLGPITGIQRCPWANKFFLTVGDWTAKIWSDDFKSPIYCSKYHSAYITDCFWVPNRTAIFFVSRSDGYIYAYDILFKTQEPVFNQKISETALTSMTINIKGDKIIIGNEEGTVFLIKLSKSFYSAEQQEMKKNLEVNNLNLMMEREVLREKGIEQILKRKGAAPKDESQAISLLDKRIKSRLESIEETYLPFLNEILQKNVISQQEKDGKEGKNQESKEKVEGKEEKKNPVIESNQSNESNKDVKSEENENKVEVENVEKEEENEKENEEKEEDEGKEKEEGENEEKEVNNENLE